MPIVLEMPALSPTMESGNLVSWLKKEGEKIEIGDIIAEIDTDKATMEFESMFSGVLAKILVVEGTEGVLVKTPIAVLRQENDSDAQLNEFILSISQGSVIKEVDVLEKPKEAVVLEQKSVCVGKCLKISPLAKRIANEYGIDLSKLNGSGPGGRIIKSDVLGYSVSKDYADLPIGEEYTDEKPSNIRKVIAEKLTLSKQQTPHFYMNASANVSELLKMRQMINNSGMVETKITVNDFIIKAVALALKNVPEINVSWQNGVVRCYKNVDVSVAVAVEGGLFTPVVKNADKKSLKEISVEIKELAAKAKSGKLLPEEFSGGGITVSNLGMFNIDSFSSIINPPQGSILSIGPAKKLPVFDDQDNVIAAFIMNIGYAVDHRVIDGAFAAKFLEVIVKYLKTPLCILC